MHTVRCLMTLLGVPRPTLVTDLPDPGRWTRWTALAVTVVGVAAFVDHSLLYDDSFDPTDPLRHGGVTPWSAFFLHGGLFHPLRRAP